jgi:hypothetical protein
MLNTKKGTTITSDVKKRVVFTDSIPTRSFKKKITSILAIASFKVIKA